MIINSHPSIWMSIKTLRNYIEWFTNQYWCIHKIEIKIICFACIPICLLHLSWGSNCFLAYSSHVLSILAKAFTKAYINKLWSIKLAWMRGHSIIYNIIAINLLIIISLITLFNYRSRLRSQNHQGTHNRLDSAFLFMQCMD